MKFFLTFLISLLTLYIMQGQEVVITYDLKLSSLPADSLNTPEVKNYMFLIKNRIDDHKGILAINGNISKYETTSEIPLGDDSSIDLAAQFTLNSKDVFYTEEEQLTLITEMLLTPLTVSFKPNYNWKLSKENSIKIKGITCHKATSEYVNIKGETKNITAYYAPSLSYPYGPAGFRGLPGLIMKLTTQEGITYTMEDIKEKRILINVPSTKVLSLQEFQQIFKRNESKFGEF